MSVTLRFCARKSRCEKVITDERSEEVSLVLRKYTENFYINHTYKFSLYKLQLLVYRTQLRKRNARSRNGSSPLRRFDWIVLYHWLLVYYTDFTLGVNFYPFFFPFILQEKTETWLNFFFFIELFEISYSSWTLLSALTLGVTRNMRSIVSITRDPVMLQVEASRDRGMTNRRNDNHTFVAAIELHYSIHIESRVNQICNVRRGDLRRIGEKNSARSSVSLKCSGYARTPRD